MYVSRIEMVGFKSFVDKTVVDLEPGLTSVVGPNGCGKTNICDAIRWVLGEENVRILRGTRAEDVIFAGTALRKPMGYAEVSMTVSDVRDVLPVEYSDVTITRRVFRSGDSEFLINNVPTRLKDIVDLFLGTGFGRRAYSVMERDMVDSILDDASGQRRKIVEEAAGISKYKARRKETVNKLELTQRDLERVEDLISEVERRVRQLARQAARARRYERLAGRIRQVETYAAAREHAVMKKRRREVEGEMEAIEVLMAEKAARISAIEADIENTKLATMEMDRDINDRGRLIAETSAAAQRLETDRGVLGERARTVDEKLGEIARSRTEKQALIGERAELAAAKGVEAAEARQRLEALSATYKQLEEEYRRLDADLRARRQESVTSARQRLEDMKRSMDAAASLTEMRTRKQHLSETIAKSLDKRGWGASRLDELRADTERAEATLGSLRAGSAADETRLADLARVIDEVTGKSDQIRSELQRLAEEGARTSSRHDVFKEIVERYEGYETGVQALMQAGGGNRGVHGVVGDVVRCIEPRYEPAIAAALSNALQYVIVEGDERAIDSVRMLKEGKKGPATLLLLDSIPTGESGAEAAGEREGVIGRVADYVDCEPKYRSVVDYLLADVFIVENLERAFLLARSATNGSHDFVTPEGDAVLRGHIVRAGSNGESSGALMGRRRKLEELAGRVEALVALSKEQEKSFQELNVSLEELRRERETVQRTVENSRKAMADVERLLESKAMERGSLERSRQELDEEIAAAKGSLDQVEARISSMTRDQGLPEAHEPRLFDSVENLEGQEREVAGLQKKLEETNLEAQRLEAAKDFIADTVRRLESETEALETGLADLDAREKALLADKQEIEKSRERLVADIARTFGVLTEMENDRTVVVEKRRGLEAAVEDARKAIKAALGEREAALQSKQAMQSELNLLEVKSDALKQRLLQEFEVNMDSVDISTLEPIDACEDELARLREHLKSLGPVNLVALEEYGVEKDRYDFLRSQRDDLLKARQSLDEAILQINKRARTEFAETFSKVKQDFRRNFQTLFAGGDADMRLQDENDPLESPIEILAQPSGKKLEHISLLSGGERALTALAFMFAAYYTRPSPFCLLDEVDAPLDDANVTRFINLLKDFSSRTQFMIVTHNKRTMESASCLYGVTMQEPGISRIVSVKLERAKNEVAEAPVAG